MFSTEIGESLISALIGGVMVAVINQVLVRRRTIAEAEKLTAEAEKIRAEAEKIRKELTTNTKELTANTQELTNEFEKLRAPVITETQNPDVTQGQPVRETDMADRIYSELAQRLPEDVKRYVKLKERLRDEKIGTLRQHIE